MKRILVLLLMLLALPATAAELNIGAPVRGKLTFGLPSRDYTLTPAQTGVLLLSLDGLHPAAQVRLTVLTAEGRIVARGGPVWTQKITGLNTEAGRTYTVRLTLLGGAPTGYALSAAWGTDPRQMFPDQPVVRDFPAGRDEVSYTYQPPEDGYLDLQLSGGTYDLDLKLRAPDGEEWSSAGQRSQENLFVRVRAGERYTVTVEKYDARGQQRLPFTLTAWQVRLSGDLSDGLERETVIDDRPRYFRVPVVNRGWLALRTGGDTAADVDLAVFRDGELAVDSLQQGLREFAVLGLQRKGEYLCRLQRGDNGWHEVPVTLAAHLVDAIPGARALAADRGAAGMFDTGTRQELLAFTAPQDGVLAVQLNGDEVGDIDLDLVVSKADGTVYFSRDGEGRETVVANLAADETIYLLPSLYHSDTSCPWRLDAAFAPRTAPVQGKPEAEWFGVFVGIKEYAEANDLEYCSKDAFDAWQAFQHLGMPAENGRLLVDEQATKENITEALRWLARVAGPEDRVVFFFSGHGVQETGGTSRNREPDGAQEYLAPFDSVNADYSHDFPDDDLGDRRDAVRAPVQGAALDVCYAGGFRQELERDGRLVLLASQEDQTSGESTKFKGGLMVGVMLRAMRDANVTAGALERAVRLQVPRICPDCFVDMGATYQRCPECGAVLAGDNRAQAPVTALGLPAELPLRLGVPQAPLPEPPPGKIIR